MTDSVSERIIVALDLPTRKEALQLVEALGDEASIVKVGAILFTEAGPSLLDELNQET